MSTLKELLEKHGLGVKVTSDGLKDNEYFEIIHVDKDGSYVTVCDSGSADIYCKDYEEDWELYKEPKKEENEISDWRYNEIIERIDMWGSSLNNMLNDMDSMIRDIKRDLGA